MAGSVGVWFRRERWEGGYSDQPRFRETEKSETFGVFSCLSDNDVIEQINVENSGCITQLVSDTDVRRAWCRVARWMIVREYDGGCAKPYGFPIRFSRMDEAGAGSSGCQLADPDEVVFPVERDHPEFFDLEFCGDGLKVAPHLIGFVKDTRLFDLGKDDPFGEFHVRLELQCLDLADSLDRHEVFLGPVNQPCERSGLGQEAIRQLEHVLLLAAAAK